ncbi:MAG: hypothetical protein WCV92_00505 [Candidatus Buchananbacteria bacterium]
MKFPTFLRRAEAPKSTTQELTAEAVEDAEQTGRSAQQKLQSTRAKYKKRLEQTGGELGEDEKDEFREKMKKQAWETFREFFTEVPMTQGERQLGLEGKVLQTSCEDHGYGIAYSREGKKLVFDRNYRRNEIEDPFSGAGSYNSLESFLIDDGYEFGNLTPDQEAVVQEANRKLFAKERIKSDLVKDLAEGWDEKTDKQKQYAQRKADALRKAFGTAVDCDYVDPGQRKMIREGFSPDETRLVAEPQSIDASNHREIKLKKSYDGILRGDVMAVFPRKELSQAIEEFDEDLGLSREVVPSNKENFKELSFSFLRKILGFDDVFERNKDGKRATETAITLANDLRARLAQIEEGVGNIAA